MTNLYLILFATIRLVSLAAGSPLTSVVTTSSGVVEGNPRKPNGVLEYLGIPYAAAPVGDLRWKSPSPAPSHTGVLNATAFGATCYQAEEGAPHFSPLSEDCLSANVWTAANQTTEKRPVMVWIYGGGFQFGSSAQPNYNGSNFAADGVVLVSFNYRIGVFGFLALPELDQEGPHNSGNFGLQDQIAALGWVKDNIANFGGDPDNVTIFGESAGAHSVGLLLASSLTTGLFNKAILESGAFWESEHGSIETFQEARNRSTIFKQNLGASNLKDLRSLTAEEVNDAALWNSTTDPGITAFAPNIDNYVLSGNPSAIFSAGKAQKVPILAGFNADEELLFLSRAIPHATTQQYTQSIDELFARNAPQALQLYPGNTQAQANSSSGTLIGDLVIRQQTWEALDSQVQFGHQTCYGYYFTYTSPYSPLAAHTAEVNFVFGNLGPNAIFGSTPPPSIADVARSKSIMNYWVNFAKSSNPNLPQAVSVQWPSYSPQGKGFLELGNNTLSISTPDVDRFDFIRSLRSNGVLPVQWRQDFTDN